MHGVSEMARSAATFTTGGVIMWKLMLTAPGRTAPLVISTNSAPVPLNHDTSTSESGW